MTAPDPGADLIDDYVEDLAARLHGPPGLRARMVEEVRGSLADAAAAHADAGMSRRCAAAAAVREFGAVDELAPGFQWELTLAQARHTAGAVVLAASALLVCWPLIWATAAGREWRLLWVVQVVAAHLIGGAVVVALLAVAMLVVTGTLARWLPTPRRLPRVVAWGGTATSVAVGVTALALVVTSVLAAPFPAVSFSALLSSLTTMPFLVVLWPLSVLTLAAHGLVGASSRACRRCARLVPTAVGHSLSD